MAGKTQKYATFAYTDYADDIDRVEEMFSGMGLTFAEGFELLFRNFLYYREFPWAIGGSPAEIAASADEVARMSEDELEAEVRRLRAERKVQRGVNLDRKLIMQISIVFLRHGLTPTEGVRMMVRPMVESGCWPYANVPLSQMRRIRSGRFDPAPGIDDPVLDYAIE